jgi:hypothetical protein
MSGQLSGLTTVVIDGTQYDAVGPATFQLSTVSREAKVAFSGNVFFTEEPVAGSIEVSLYVPPGMDPSLFNDMIDVTVIVQLASGTNLVAYDAFLSDKIEFEAKEGTIKTTWTSRTVTITTT